MQTRPDHIAANAPETIDANFHCHFSGLSPQDLGVKFQDSKRRAEVPGWRVDVIDPTTSSGQVVRKLVCASWPELVVGSITSTRHPRTSADRKSTRLNSSHT